MASHAKETRAPAIAQHSKSSPVSIPDLDSMPSFRYPDNAQGQAEFFANPNNRAFKHAKKRFSIRDIGAKISNLVCDIVRLSHHTLATIYRKRLIEFASSHEFSGRLSIEQMSKEDIQSVAAGVLDDLLPIDDRTLLTLEGFDEWMSAALQFLVRKYLNRKYWKMGNHLESQLSATIEAMGEAEAPAVEDDDFESSPDKDGIESEKATITVQNNNSTSTSNGESLEKTAATHSFADRPSMLTFRGHSLDEEPLPRYPTSSLELLGGIAYQNEPEDSPSLGTCSGISENEQQNNTNNVDVPNFKTLLSSTTEFINSNEVMAQDELDMEDGAMEDFELVENAFDRYNSMIAHHNQLREQYKKEYQELRRTYCPVHGPAEMCPKDYQNIRGSLYQRMLTVLVTPPNLRCEREKTNIEVEFDALIAESPEQYPVPHDSTSAVSLWNMAHRNENMAGTVEQLHDQISQ